VADLVNIGYHVGFSTKSLFGLDLDFSAFAGFHESSKALLCIVSLYVSSSHWNLVRSVFQTMKSNR